MSLYHLVHGENPFARVLLAALDLTPTAIPRYRDCWWDGTYICVHTRTGGGNRDEYAAENEALRQIPGFDHDVDDDFDSTYATFYFVPSPAVATALASVPATETTPAQRWQAVFEKLRCGISDPQIDRVTEALKPLVAAITKDVR